jgi:transcriptional regulator with XRE-family HTH domain
MRIEGRLETRPQGDRRTAPRRELHLRLATLGGKQAVANVVVLDLSQTGLLIQTTLHLAIDDSLQINLPHSGFQAARVVWISGELVGCRFEEPISAATVSAAQLRSEPEGAVGPVSRAALESNSPEDDSLGSRLRSLRQQYNLSQTGLAQLLNVSKLSVWKWERNDARPRQTTLEALAKLFAVSDRDLLLGTSDRAAEAEAATQSGTQGPGGLVSLIDECKAKIADCLGTTTDQVEITVTL